MKNQNKLETKYWIYSPEVLSQDREDLVLILNKENIDKVKSHYIMGRWENIYIPISNVPQVVNILRLAGKMANKILDKQAIVPHKELGHSHDEFWFNIAKPGQSTAWHDHKKGAILSGVYYIDIPEKGGNIKFRKTENNSYEEWVIPSVTGQMIFFPSVLDHAVEENKADRERISLAFNFFTLPLDFTSDQDTYSSSKYYG